VLLIVAALAFALVCGANDGAALIALNLNDDFVRPLWALLALSIVVALGPVLLGTEVATTFVHRLVAFEGDTGRSALLAAVLVAVTVVFVLQRQGLPTSLTLALTGAIVGVGLGSGLAIGWGSVLLTLLAGALAPLASGGLAFLAQRSLPLVPRRGGLHVRLAILRLGGFFLQCLAYAANDGQKMVAVLAVATGTVTPRLRLEVPELAAIGVLFGAGTLGGIRRYGNALGRGIAPARPAQVGIAQLSSAVAVFAGAAIGAPVSMTQSTTAALVGAGASAAYRQVRWGQASRIVVAWVITLPASVAIAALFAAVAGWAR
jgi:inorganic phosphate transporter, PiT family